MLISNNNSFRVLFDKTASAYFIWKYIYILALEMSSPGNRHCANCIGTLSYLIRTRKCVNKSEPDATTFPATTWARPWRQTMPRESITLHGIDVCSTGRNSYEAAIYTADGRRWRCYFAVCAAFSAAPRRLAQSYLLIATSVGRRQSTPCKASSLL